ncbi:MAG: hypothetical protein MHPSP_002343, partial [Paramarteilia canceri]
MWHNISRPALIHPTVFENLINQILGFLDDGLTSQSAGPAPEELIEQLPTGKMTPQKL